MPLVDAASAGSQLTYSLRYRIPVPRGGLIGAFSYRVLVQKETARLAIACALVRHFKNVNGRPFCVIGAANGSVR
jgi:hypothetical protein